MRRGRSVLLLGLAWLLAGCAAVAGGGSPSVFPSADGASAAASSSPSSLVAQRKAAGIADCPASGRAPAVAGGLPDVTLSCLGGGATVRLAGLRGPMLVNFWAQWCEECRGESAHLAAFARVQKKVKVLGVDFNDPQPDLAIEFAQLTDMTYPHLADPAGLTKAGLGVVGIPASFLLDADGSIVARHFGAFDSLEAVQHWVGQGLAR